MKILVSIPSRGSPQRLRETLEMVYSTCSNKDNFDVQVITCKDEKELYSPIKQYKIIWDEIPFQKESWSNLIQSQNKRMKKGDYYFFMFLSDDLRGLTDNWDEEILKKKHAFSDDLFVLYSKNQLWGRTPERKKDCYVDMRDKEADIFKLFEHVPVSTYKFLEYINFLFEEPYNFKYGREVIIADLLKQLALKGIPRNIEADFSYEKLTCNKLDDKNYFEGFLQIQNDDSRLLKGIATLIKHKLEEK